MGRHDTAQNTDYKNSIFRLFGLLRQRRPPVPDNKLGDSSLVVKAGMP
jgi:hypothetical protein